jgi:CubicO group peptidase (beta-lactamase class C family)
MARAFIARQRIPGVSVAVAHRGRQVYASAFGLANLELEAAATPDTVYEIGSISKQFAAQAIMTLVEAGSVGLDRTVGAYLPALPEAWSSVTIRHLLTHTSGIPDWEALGLLSYRQEYTIEEFVDLLAKLPLDFQPGTRFAYSNSTFPLLGAVIARVTGVSFEDYVRDHVFKPAGLVQTRFKTPAELVKRRASGYVDRGGILVNGEALRPRVIAANGGILSTAPDMVAWLAALAAGRIVKPQTLDLMRAPLQLANGQPYNAGIAWFLDTFRGHRVLLHNGSTVGGFSSVVYWYPDDELAVAVLMNIDRWNAVNVLATKVANAFVPGLSTGELAARTDLEPDLTANLLGLLRAIADGRDSALLAPSLRTPSGRPRVPPGFGFGGTADRFELLDREDFGASGVLRFGQTIRWIYRYKLRSGTRTVCYTFELTPGRLVARLIPEDE